MAIGYSASRNTFWRFVSARILSVIVPCADELPPGPSDCVWLVPDISLFNGEA